MAAPARAGHRGRVPVQVHRGLARAGDARVLRHVAGRAPVVAPSGVLSGGPGRAGHGLARHRLERGPRLAVAEAAPRGATGAGRALGLEQCGPGRGRPDWLLPPAPVPGVARGPRCHALARPTRRAVPLSSRGELAGCAPETWRQPWPYWRPRPGKERLPGRVGGTSGEMATFLPQSRTVWPPWGGSWAGSRVLRSFRRRYRPGTTPALAADLALGLLAAGLAVVSFICCPGPTPSAPAVVAWRRA